MLSQAYGVMGNSYRQLGKKSKSVACFTLAAKLNPGSNMTMDNLREALRAAAVEETPNVQQRFFIEKEVSDPSPNAHLHLNNIELKSLQDPAEFTCNSCGECCRTRKRVELSPLDLYLLTRHSILLDYFVVQNTLTLYKSKHFEGVFHFSLDEHGQPSCALRPSAQDTGQCKFAYPLFKHPTVSTGGAATSLLNYEDTAEYLDFYNSQYQANQEVWEDQLEAEEWLQRENDMEEKYGEVIPSTTRSGRQALGCMLGSSMPTACASFPFSPELVYADTSYRDVDWEDGAIVTQKGDCEGFDPNLAPNEEFPSVMASASITAREQRATQRSTETKEEEEEEEEDDKTPQTVLDYLTTSQLQPELVKHYEEFRWFCSLKEALRTELPPNLTTLRSKGVLDHFLHILTQVWYNFDILAKQRRPIKSYQRVKQEISTASWNVVRVTKTWLAALPSPQQQWSTEKKNDELVENYKAVMKRLNTLNEQQQQ